ncbi:MAG: hypothetical protein ACRCV6_10580 [Formosimonas sp.]
MQRYFICFSTALLAACATHPIQNMSLKDAVAFGSEQYYNTPNYAFNGSSRVAHVSVQNQSTPTEINALISRLAGRLSFDIDGVVDQPNKLYEFTPRYQYKAKNLQANIVFPMVYDGHNQAFLIDTSALDALVSKPENEGKYSRFDLSSFNANDKGKQLLDVLQKYTSSMYQKMPDAAFSELPLNSEDKNLNVVRKIQIDSRPQDASFDTTGLMKDIFKIIQPSHESQTNDAQKAQEKLNEMISPDAKQISILSFDKNGHVIRMQSDLDLTIKPSSDAPSDNNIRLKTSGSFNIHHIGQAKLHNPPSADNTVDGIENFKGSFIGSLFKGFFKPNDDAQEANSPAVEAAEAAAEAVVVQPRKKRR